MIKTTEWELVSPQNRILYRNLVLAGDLDSLAKANMLYSYASADSAALTRHRGTIAEINGLPTAGSVRREGDAIDAEMAEIDAEIERLQNRRVDLSHQRGNLAPPDTRRGQLLPRLGQMRESTRFVMESELAAL